MANERCLITGGAGFIGSHMTEHYIRNTDWEIVILDSLTYAGDLNRIVDSGVDLSRIKYVYHDIRAPLNERIISEIGDVQYIVHSAAQTHVENSLHDPEPFVYTNVVGTFNMLEYAKKLNEKGMLKKYIQISTDETYGPAPVGTNWKEWDRFAPSNPYSACKAGGDCLAYAYSTCYQLPVTTTSTMNNFGERQHSEKFLPLIMGSILNGKKINVHGEKNGDGSWTSGSRIWLHARNHADAVLFLLRNYDKIDDKRINIVGNVEASNLNMVEKIGEIIGKKPIWEWLDFHSERPGHDLRYALDGSRLAELGWKAPVSFRKSLARTVQWTMENPKYLEW